MVLDPTPIFILFFNRNRNEKFSLSTPLTFYHLSQTLKDLFRTRLGGRLAEALEGSEFKTWY